MSVFVDDAQIPYKSMKMCHMLADSTEELIAMAEAIGINRRHIQHAGTYREHFDVCLAKRQEAIKRGAIKVTFREVAKMLKRRRECSNT